MFYLYLLSQYTYNKIPMTFNSLCALVLKLKNMECCEIFFVSELHLLNDITYNEAHMFHYKMKNRN